MNRLQIIIITVTIAITVAVVVFWVNYNKPKETKMSNVEVSDLVYREELPENPDGTVTLNFDSLKDAKHITVEKVVRTITEDGDGNSETVYDTYLLSDIDLNKGIDNTEEFAAAASGPVYEDDKVCEVKFSDECGFEYANLSGLEVHDKLLESMGFDGDATKAVFDKETYDKNKQQLFVYEDGCTALDNLLPDHEVEILESKAYFQIMKDAKGKTLPEYYVARVQYKDGDVTVEKSIYLQISVNNWEVV